MHTRIFIGIIVLTIAGFASYRVYQNKQPVTPATTTKGVASPATAAAPAPKAAEQTAKVIPASQREPLVVEVIDVNIKRGNMLSVICQDLYGNGTPAVYRAVALAASGKGLPDPNNPDLILAGEVIVLPVAITVNGRTYVANVARAKQRVEERSAARAVVQPITPANDATATASVPVIASAIQPLTSAALASINVAASTPSANIFAIGTLGNHAPPTGNQARKEHMPWRSV